MVDQLLTKSIPGLHKSIKEKLHSADLRTERNIEELGIREVARRSLLNSQEILDLVENFNCRGICFGSKKESVEFFHSIKIVDSGFSTRLRSVALATNLETIGGLKTLSEAEFMKEPNAGRATWEQWQKYLDNNDPMRNQANLTL